MVDRQSKFLLAVIAIALCGILVQNELRTQAAHASALEDSSATSPAIGCLNDNPECFLVEDHKVYLVGPTSNGVTIDYVRRLK